MRFRAAILGIGGLELSADEAELFQRHPPAGVILFRRNIRDPEQLGRLTASLRRILPEVAVIAVDQEGGRVARLRPPHWREHPAAAALGELFARDVTAGLHAAWLTGVLIGMECARAGFDMVCAPVLDLRHPGRHDVIGDRAFSAEPAKVTALGSVLAEGLLSAGILPVVKHVPGHGHATVDSHVALPVVPAGADLMPDMQPFATAKDLPWMMTAHVVYPEWDAALPATLSPTVIQDVIRGRIGFDGVLVSDDLAMGALTGAPASRVQAALAAGCDIALYCSGDIQANAAILADCPDAGPAALDRMRRGRAQVEKARKGTAGNADDDAALAAWRAKLLG